MVAFVTSMQIMMLCRHALNYEVLMVVDRFAEVS